jgi:predicted Zn-dependent protease
VVNDKSINAFALPGGPMFVHTGLIASADNEAQIAGVFAHEISHVALRHGTNQASKSSLLQLPAALAGGAVGNGSILGQLAQMGIGFGANSLLLRYSRNAERDADLMGTRMMAGAGYDPIEMARFFEKLKGEAGTAKGLQFFSDHPDPGNRVKAVEDEIRYLPTHPKASLGNAAELRRMQDVVRSLPEPPKRVVPQQQGQAR